MIAFALPVLYNICLDYGEFYAIRIKSGVLIILGPAQKQTSDCALTKVIVEMITPTRKWMIRPYIGYVRKIMELLVTQRKHHYDRPIIAC